GADQVLTASFTPLEFNNFNTAEVSVTIDVLDVQDFGDAPGPYPVALADDGARHTTGALRLGASVDTEREGQASDLADADQADDGVVPLADLVALSTADTVSSFLVEASQPGRLDAWIDFNQDGDWDDLGEQISNSLELAAGASVVSFTVPTGAAPGTTAARFRISSAGGLAPTGAAADGEVEDYLVTLRDGDVTTEVSVGLVEAALAIHLETDEIRASAGDAVVFAAPSVNVRRLNVQGTLANETITVEAAQTVTGLNLIGGGGDDVLRLAGDGGVFNLTDGSLHLQDFPSLDLSADGGSLLTLDAASVNALSPSSRTLAVIAGQGDKIAFSDSSDWRLTEPLVTPLRFVRTAINTANGQQRVQFDAPNPWQNFLRLGDVNNDGLVTARDGLLIINELGRRAFSDPDTQVLNSPVETTPWPGFYFDHSGDGRVTALDAVRVINDLARLSSNTADAEAVISGGSQTNSLAVTDDDAPARVPPAEVISPAAAGPLDFKLDELVPRSSNQSLPAPNRSSAEDSSLAEQVDELLGDKVFLDGLRA
ncbi:MAG: GEVED domain-containing protein, partial [Pirellulales bacterium]|nr:GEVED domain-containing protein [Pirellulales bacterium]